MRNEKLLSKLLWCHVQLTMKSTNPEYPYKLLSSFCMQMLALYNLSSELHKWVSFLLFPLYVLGVHKMIYDFILNKVAKVRMFFIRW